MFSQEYKTDYTHLPLRIMNTNECYCGERYICTGQVVPPNGRAINHFSD